MNRLGGAAVAAEVLSPFDVQGGLPRKLRPRYFHSATGNFCRGLSGCSEQFGKRMARYLEVSYSNFRLLGLGSDFWLFTHSIVGRELVREKPKDAAVIQTCRVIVDDFREQARSYL